MKSLEEKLGYQFKNLSLLEHAMTNSSYANEHRSEGVTSNERLEFWGIRSWALWWHSICFPRIPTCRRGS